jgi:hypothetical protein
MLSTKKRRQRRRHRQSGIAGSWFSPETIPRGWVSCRSFTVTPPWRKTTPKGAIVARANTSRAGLSSEIPHTKTPSPGQHTIQIASSTLPSLSKLCGPPPPQGPDGAHPHGTIAHMHEGSKSTVVEPLRRHAAEPGTCKQTTSYLRGPRSPDGAQAAQIEPARAGARKLAGPPAAPGWRTTSPDHAVAPASQHRRVGKRAPPLTTRPAEAPPLHA